MHAVVLLFVLKFGHCLGYCLHVFTRIVWQAATSQGLTYLFLSDFAEYFISAADTIVIHNSIVVVLIEKVIVAVLRGRLEGLLQVGSVAVVVLRCFLQDALVVALLLHSVKQLGVVSALQVGNGGVESRLFLCCDTWS